MHVLVIGGGLMGVSTAYYLVEAGHRVTLVERQPELAAEGSHSNGGMLHASHTEPWNTPEAIRQFLQWIGREESPLLLRPGQIPNLIGWGLGFLRYSRTHHHERNTRVNTRLAVYSQRLMAGIREATGLEYDADHRGILKIFRDRREYEHALAGSALTESLGVRFERLGTDEVIGVEPTLADVAGDIVGGIHYPDDESGDARRFVEGLGEWLRGQGAELRLGESVQRIDGGADGIAGVVTDRDTLTADAYVLASGVDAPAHVRPLGVNLPIRPVKGYSATLPVDGDAGAPRVPIIDEGNKVVITRLGERLRVAGTAEFAGMDRSVRERRVEIVVRQALSNFPAYASRVERSAAEPWACLRPMTKDGPPILGDSGVPGLFLNVGPGHLGWTFAAGAGRVVADCVIGRDPEIDMQGLTLARYRRQPRG
ncbi:D-amino acid dehydrogenase 1 [wastewater metagenome]|uniref:D-amino acid dehydrogenase 1 n=4 Tax=root TaxID=1 RepID=A0A5B8R866_9ZZZZ|nr:D-amino acid dehydrogenase [Arhodomonas aquaeolei]QEA04168.1 D-amino acid dehydrogenase 1 [uncultured organism]